MPVSPGAADGSATPPDRARWRSALHARFKERPHPLSVLPEETIPAASVWTGSRVWVAAFRDQGLRAGDRIVLALPPSSAFLQVLVAALWEGLTIIPVPPGEDFAPLVEHLDARCAITTTDGRWCVPPDGPSGPATGTWTLRPSVYPQLPDLRFLLRTSGSTRAPKWIGLSDTNVWAVLDSHLPHMNLEGARVLSVLPWFHAFGLILDLLPTLLKADELIRDPNQGRDPEQLIRLANEHDCTYLSAVPLTIQRLAESVDGQRLLRRLDGGIVGGAPVSSMLAQWLRRTSLQAGYGQTEASPGLMLGAPGEWEAHLIGQPVGCEVRTTEDGELLFRGPNAHAIRWTSGGPVHLDPERWVATGDLVTCDDGFWYYQGRVDDCFKLSNGRMVQAGRYEARLKQHLPDLEEALLLTHDGTTLDLYVLTSSEPPSLEEVRSLMGSLGSRVQRVHTLLANEWLRSRKGAVARQAMTEYLSGRPRTGAGALA